MPPVQAFEGTQTTHLLWYEGDGLFLDQSFHSRDSLYSVFMRGLAVTVPLREKRFKQMSVQSAWN